MFKGLLLYVICALTIAAAEHRVQYGNIPNDIEIIILLLCILFGVSVTKYDRN